MLFNGTRTGRMVMEEAIRGRLRAFNARSVDPRQHLRMVRDERFVKWGLYACELRVCCEHSAWVKCLVWADGETVEVMDVGPHLGRWRYGWDQLAEAWERMEGIRRELEACDDPELEWELEDWVSAGYGGGTHGPPIGDREPVLEFAAEDLWCVGEAAPPRPGIDAP